MQITLTTPKEVKKKLLEASREFVAKGGKIVWDSYGDSIASACIATAYQLQHGLKKRHEVFAHLGISGPDMNQVIRAFDCADIKITKWSRVGFALHKKLNPKKWH